MERLGSVLRQISHTLESPHASFAARIACAVLCSQIPAYLRQTQAWYNAYRGVWASITIATCTTRTIGQSAFGIAVCKSCLQRMQSSVRNRTLISLNTVSGARHSVWVSRKLDRLVHCRVRQILFLNDQALLTASSRKIPGVIIFYLLLLTIAQWPARKDPSFTPLTMANAIFLTLLVGYELESERLGEAVIISRGQPYHPPYLLSWMALLAVRILSKHVLTMLIDV